MTHLSLEGTSVMEEDNLAPIRMSQAIQGLDNILQIFQDVESMPESRTAASTTKAPNGAAFVNEVMITKQPTGPTPALDGGTLTEVLSKACIQESNPKLVNRAREGAQMGCRHFGEHHLGVIDPCIWSALPEELVEIVFAKLPMPKIIDLIRDSEAWSTLSESPNFRQRCSERHFFSLMRWDSASVEGDTVRATVFDITSNEWVGFDLAGFPASGRCSGAKVNHGYEDSMYAHDGGLVCFIPPSDLAVAPVLVSNPLTGEWRSLPLIPHEHKPTLLVQLESDMDTKGYKVMLVCGHTQMKHLELCVTPTPENTAHCYDSSTGVWSTMETGFVYGGCGSLQQFQAKVPCVFDCKKKLLYYLKYHVPLRQPFSWSSVKDCLVVLYDSTSISDFAWRGRYSIQSTIALGPYAYKSKPPHQVFLFASANFILVIGDSSVKTHGKYGQIIQVYDRSAKKWHLASPMPLFENSHPHCLRKAFTCELRWDAVP